MKYRNEWKFRINENDAFILKHRLSLLCQSDPHCTDGIYSIRSLYFDNYLNKAFREKLDGINRREKFRIRYYNNDLSFIRLEKKVKVNNMGTKHSTLLNPAEVISIINGEWGFINDRDDPLLKELYNKYYTQALRPKTIVQYMRTPFIFPINNVRITIDENIRTGISNTNFLNFKSPTVPIKDNPIIMEIKWDNSLPDAVKNILAIPNRTSGAFSKYASCRGYDI